MAQHMQALPAHDQLAMLEALPTLQQLYTVTGSVLRQLSEGLQQYQQQGQLPAALTAHAVDGCNALCMTLTSVLELSVQQPGGMPFNHQMLRSFKAAMRGTGKHSSSRYQLVGPLEPAAICNAVSCPVLVNRALLVVWPSQLLQLLLMLLVLILQATSKALQQPASRLLLC
jgi:hypothetical protein